MSDLGPPETSSLDELLLVLYIEIEASIDLKILTSKKIDGPKCLRFPALTATLKGYFLQILQLSSSHEWPGTCECQKSVKNTPAR